MKDTIIVCDHLSRANTEDEEKQKRRITRVPFVASGWSRSYFVHMISLCTRSARVFVQKQEHNNMKTIQCFMLSAAGLANIPSSLSLSSHTQTHSDLLSAKLQMKRHTELDSPNTWMAITDTSYPNIQLLLHEEPVRFYDE